MIRPKKLSYALLLVGGHSSRLNSPKALLKLGSHSGEQGAQALWQRGERALQAVCEQVYFSISAKFTDLPVPKSRLIFDEEAYGPLSGICSALRKHPAACLVLACDMPGFNQAAAIYLLSRRDPSKLATVFTNSAGDLEPLAGIYEPASASYLEQALKDSQAGGTRCMRKILANLDIARISALDNQWLANINYPEDLARAQELAGQEKHIRIQFFASLREQAGLAEFELRTRAQTLADLYIDMQRLFNFSCPANNLRFAQNEHLVNSQDNILDQAHIVFLPPVSGG